MPSLAKLFECEELVLMVLESRFWRIRKRVSRHMMTKMEARTGLGSTCKRLRKLVVGLTESPGFLRFMTRVRVTMALVERMRAYVLSDYDGMRTNVTYDWSQAHKQTQTRQWESCFNFSVKVYHRQNSYRSLLRVEMLVDEKVLSFDKEEEEENATRVLATVEAGNVRMLQYHETREDEIARKSEQLQVFIYLPHYPSTSFEVLVGENEAKGLIRFEDLKRYTNGLWEALFEQGYLPRDFKIH